MLTPPPTGLTPPSYEEYCACTDSSNRLVYLRASVVTGSGHGIGRAYAEQLAGYGLKVLIISLGQEACEEVATSIGEERRIICRHGDRFIPVQTALFTCSAQVEQESILVGLVPSTGQLNVLWWPPPDASTGGVGRRGGLK